MPVVLAWQEGRIHFYLTLSWFMSGELLQFSPLVFGHEHVVLLSARELCLVEDAALLYHETQYLSNQSWFFCTKQQMDFYLVSAHSLIHTEDKFSLSVFLFYKMCSLGIRMQILICVHGQILFPSTFWVCNLLSTLYHLFYSPIWFKLWFNSSLPCTCPFYIHFFSPLYYLTFPRPYLKDIYCPFYCYIALSNLLP